MSELTSVSEKYTHFCQKNLPLAKCQSVYLSSHETNVKHLVTRQEYVPSNT